MDQPAFLADAALPSLRDGFRAAVIGATGGIGGALLTALQENPRCGDAIGLARNPQPGMIPIDLDDETSLIAAAASLSGDGNLDLIINATGRLHDQDTGLTPEKSWKHLDAARLVESYRANCIGPAMLAKHFLPLLPRQGKAVMAFLSARVGSISDNRSGGWHGYRAAKAGLNMMIRNFSHEMRFRNADAVILGLHPGTVETRLSAPFRNTARHDILAPASSATHLLQVIDAAGAPVSGSCIDWKGQIIPG
ncbi:MAG: SDR family NAD(P)-dependent oxidoreductase [Candidatus Puniceispirillales bacterium]